MRHHLAEGAKYMAKLRRNKKMLAKTYKKRKAEDDMMDDRKNIEVTS